MTTDRFEQIQKLIDHKLSEKEEKEIIAEIKNSKELKLEFALLAKIKQNSGIALKQQLLNRMRSTIPHSEVGPAANALSYINAAAFSAKDPSDAEDLPIDESTINEFLNDTEEQEEEKDE